ncbi:MAG: DUF4185 domain-containing protein [Dehalococcoidia bacterium]
MKIRLSPLAGPALLAASALLAVSGLVLLAARTLRSSAAVPPPASAPLAAAPPATAPMAPAARAELVCSFSNADAVASQVQGADGGQSVVVGDRTYWLFGDTLFLPASGKQIEPNSIAWSSGDAPGRCPKLRYHARDGVAVPFIPKDGSLTVWPAGAFPVDAHSFDVYTVYVYGSGPYAYWIGEVGLARVDTASMRVETLSRRLWDASSGFEDQVIGAQPVDSAGGFLRVVLQTQGGDHLLARVRPADVADARAYRYWDGAGWSPRPAAAVPIWPHARTTDPLARIASYDDGGSIAYNAYLGKYVAVVNDGIGKIAARVADRLEGPWSAPADWIDCSAIAQPAVPVCYSPYQHPQLATDGGRGLFLTFTRMAAYDVVAYRIELGPPGAAQGRAR